MSEGSSGGLEHCIKFLKGNNDEQRLVGLLLATKHVQGNDKDAILQVYNAIGIQFVIRLLKSGVQVTSGRSVDEEEPYTRLAMTILSAFCKVPELACLDEIVDRVPAVLEVLGNTQDTLTISDILECLLGIGLASEKGLLSLRNSRAFSLILDCISRSKGESMSLHCGVKILQLLLNGCMLEKEVSESSASILSAIPVLAEVFASEQGSFKFDILILLRALCSPHFLVQDQLCKGGNSEDTWHKFIRSGVAQVLQGQFELEQKHHALGLTASVIDKFGTSWLLGHMALPGEKNGLPLDRFFLLLVETLRIETIVLLNEVARSLFDQDHAASSRSEQPNKKIQILSTCYILLESIITTTVEESDDKRLSDHVLKQTVSSLNEIVNTVFEFLEEAKKQRIRKTDFLLASVRLIGRYLADAPSFQKEFRKKFFSMLEYLFTICSDHEESPFLVIQFLLPALSQLTMEKKGCEALVSWGGHKQVVRFMMKAIQTDVSVDLVIKAGDVILNLLQKDARFDDYIVVVDFLPLLSALPSWAERLRERTVLSMAACICVMILDLSNETEILQKTSVEMLAHAYAPIVQTLKLLGQTDAPDLDDEQDLWELTLSACIELTERYPSLKHCIKSSSIVVKPSNSATKLLLRALLEDC